MKQQHKKIIYVGVSAINSGKRSGKDTFADYAIDYINSLDTLNNPEVPDIYVMKESFAEPLKRICEILGLDYNMLNGTEKEKESLTDWDWPANNQYGKTGKMTYREVAQYIGSDLFRNNFHIDVWPIVMKKNVEKKVRDIQKMNYSLLSGSDYVDMDCFNEYLEQDNSTFIVFAPDVRFPNETEILDYLVDIDRSKERNIENDQHISEQAGKLIKKENISMRVYNWNNLEYLKAAAEDFVNKNLIAYKRILLRKNPFYEFK